MGRLTVIEEMERNIAIKRLLIEGKTQREIQKELKTSPKVITRFRKELIEEGKLPITRNGSKKGDSIGSVPGDSIGSVNIRKMGSETPELFNPDVGDSIGSVPSDSDGSIEKQISKEKNLPHFIIGCEDLENFEELKRKFLVWAEMIAKDSMNEFPGQRSILRQFKKYGKVASISQSLELFFHFLKGVMVK